MRVAVYCSSSANIHKKYVDFAFDLGTALALNGIDLVWGGGQVSMMGAVARAVRQGGRKTFGVIPEHLTNLELSDPESDEMFVVDTMRNRKQKMDDLSDAFIVLPGGIGTLEEFFEIWTSKYLGITPKVFRPASRTAFATAPIIETWPPPQTKSIPFRASAVPRSKAKSMYRLSILADEEQKTATLIAPHS